MRILWVKLGGLWPLTSGGRIRTFHTIRELSERHDLTVLTTHGPDDDPDGLRAMLPRSEVISLPHSPPKQGSLGFALALARSWLSPLPVDLWRWRSEAVRAAVAEQLARGDLDLCVADFLTAMPNVPATRLPLVLFEHNVEHVIWRRLSDRVPAWQRPLVELEWRKLRRYERNACSRATLTIAVSEADRELLASIAPRASVCAVPTGVDTDYFAPPDGSASHNGGGLAFVGSMDWYPNEDAVLYLIDAVLPLVRAQVPDAALTIVGRNPSERVQAAAAAAGAAVTGTVPDVRPYVADAAVLVIPLRVGGGTRLKLFESLAMGKAVVSTSIGAEGLPLAPGEHYVQADEPPELAREIVSLLRDPPRREAIGQAGRRFVVERFSWPQVAREFEQRLKRLAP